MYWNATEEQVKNMTIRYKKIQYKTINKRQKTQRVMNLKNNKTK